MTDITVRPATQADEGAVWAILEPVIRAGETYPLPRDMHRDDALAYWLQEGHETFVAEDRADILGTYYMRPNNAGGGNHICNCGYITAENARGKGVARTMCTHSLDHARERGYRGMQFNFVIANNTRAVALWNRMGFEVVGRIPRVFNHPGEGYVDALVMFQTL